MRLTACNQAESRPQWRGWRSWVSRPLPVMTLAAAAVLAVAVQPLAAGSNNGLTQADKFAILRSMVTEVGVARRPIPPDSKGIEIDPSGKILNADHVQSALQAPNENRTGSSVTISAIDFKADRIVFALNGGPPKTHWYNHVELGVGTAMTPIATNAQPESYGAVVTLRFPGKIPHLTPDQVRAYLNPIIDWDPQPKAEVMVRKLPTVVKQAIDAHHVLVGMNADEVVATLGRTDNKDREADPATGQEYEEWIYGGPPHDTIFVRFVGASVVRVETCKTDGSILVDTTPSPALLPGNTPGAAATASADAAADSDAAPQMAPTLRRPGEVEDQTSSPRAAQNTPVAATPQPGDPPLPPPGEGGMPSASPPPGTIGGSDSANVGGTTVDGSASTTSGPTVPQTGGPPMCCSLKN